MSNRDGNRLLIVGTSGTGKTNLARVLTQQTERLLVFDPDEQFTRMPHMMQVNREADLLELLRDCRHSSFRISYEPESADWAGQLGKFSQVLMDLQTPYRKGDKDAKPLTLVVDEMHQFFPLNVSQKHGFCGVAKQGRKYGINVIGITPRPADVATDFRDNCNRCAAFYITGDNGKRAVSKIMDDDQSVVQGITDLKPYHHILWEMGQQTKWEYMAPVPLFADP